MMTPSKADTKADRQCTLVVGLVGVQDGSSNPNNPNRSIHSRIMAWDTHTRATAPCHHNKGICSLVMANLNFRAMVKSPKPV